MGLAKRLAALADTLRAGEREALRTLAADVALLEREAQTLRDLHAADMLLIEALRDLHAADMLLIEALRDLHAADTLLIEALRDLHAADMLLIETRRADLDALAATADTKTMELKQ